MTDKARKPPTQPTPPAEAIERWDDEGGAMGYVFAHSICFGCKQPFAYNPMKVPSIRVDGVREPICQTCVDRINPERIKKGLPPIVPAADAYEPCDESELDG